MVQFMGKIRAKEIISAFLFFLLVLSPISLIPSAIGGICRYLFIIFGILYLFVSKKKLIISVFHNLIYLYLIASVISLVTSPYLDVNLALSFFQFSLFIIIII